MNDNANANANDNDNVNDNNLDIDLLQLLVEVVRYIRRDPGISAAPTDAILSRLQGAIDELTYRISNRSRD